MNSGYAQDSRRARHVHAPTHRIQAMNKLMRLTGRRRLATKKYGLTVCVGALPPMLRGGGHEGVEGFFKAVRKVPFTL